MTIELSPAPRRAHWLRPFGWRKLAYGVDDRLVVVREGVLYRTLTIVPHAKTQSVRMTEGPLQRRLGLATVHVDTTPGPVDAAIRHRFAAEARRITEEQAGRARLARRADVPEQWMAQFPSPSRDEPDGHADGDGPPAASNERDQE